MTIKELEIEISKYSNYDKEYLNDLWVFILNIDNIKHIDNLKLQFWEMVSHKLSLESEILKHQEKILSLQNEMKELICKK